MIIKGTFEQRLESRITRPPELILGVAHKTSLAEYTIDLLNNLYPGGISSLMLEIVPWIPLEGYTEDGFFSEIGKYFRDRGSKIIQGDIGRTIPPRFIYDLYHRKSDDMSLKECFMGLFYELFVEIPRDIYLTLGKRRDRGMAKAIIETNPKVVVVGRWHADYLKKLFKSSEYIAYTINSRSLDYIQSMLRYPRNPYKPDRTIDVTDLWRKHNKSKSSSQTTDL